MRVAHTTMEEMVQISASTHSSIAPFARSFYPVASAIPSRRLEILSERDENRNIKKKRKEIVEMQTARAGSDTKWKFHQKLTEVSPRLSSRLGVTSLVRDSSLPEHVQGCFPVRRILTGTIKLCLDEPMKPKTSPLAPPLAIPVFSGDPLKYRCFIREFKHFVEGKTACNAERLHYMLQLTSGDPRELVRSCLHMHVEHAYHKAKALLKKHYGKPHTISAAYVDKALNWPALRSADGRALLSLGLFLKECHQALTELRRVRELERSLLTQAVVAKLPYRLRDRWGGRVRDIKRDEKRSARFSDLVDFVNNHAEAALDRAYGHLLERRKQQPRNAESSRPQRRTSASGEAALAPAGQACAFSPPCLYCRGGEHAMEQCGAMDKVPYKEKIRFLRVKGLCFGCLRQGHTSSSCQERTSCRLCAQSHPTLLHSRVNPGAAHTQVEAGAKSKAEHCRLQPFDFIFLVILTFSQNELSSLCSCGAASCSLILQKDEKKQGCFKGRGQHLAGGVVETSVPCVT